MPKSNKVSEHFTEDELRCKCGCGRLIYDPELPVLMEVVRELNGDKPITPNSVYRCAEHNKEVGGAANSFHLAGKAADMPVDDPVRIWMLMKAMFPKHFGLGVYDTFIHVDVRVIPARWDNRTEK